MEAITQPTLSTPVWALLGFAVWTVLTLLGSVGVYRWSRILTGRAELKDFRAEAPEGSDWYLRAMRAHANCLENLPVFGAIVLAVVASGVASPALDRLASVVLGARICQTVVHIGLRPTNPVVAVRFAFFFAQLACMLAMAWIVFRTAWH